MATVIDTNLLVLLTAGRYFGRHLFQHKRLKIHTYYHFELLNELHSELGAPLVAPPHVMAETSNLLVQGLSEPHRSRLLQVFAELMSLIKEHHFESQLASQRPEYLRLGLTDAVLICLADTNDTLITMDLNLYLAALKAGHRAINFNHIIDQP